MRPLTEARLRRAFTDVLALLVTTAGATAIAGCGATTGTDDPGGVGGGGGGTRPVFTTLCAKDISGVSFSDGLKAAPLLDGAVTRSESAFLAPNVSMSNGGVTGSTAGGEATIRRRTARSRARCALRRRIRRPMRRR
ncbi:MAG: hypothetical protein U0235_26300 [Polyangiaceae bacterium]